MRKVSIHELMSVKAIGDFFVQSMDDLWRIACFWLVQARICAALIKTQKFPLALELAGPATILGVRHELDLL